MKLTLQFLNQMLKDLELFFEVCKQLFNLIEQLRSNTIKQHLLDFSVRTMPLFLTSLFEKSVNYPFFEENDGLLTLGVFYFHYKKFFIKKNRTFASQARI